MATKNNSPYIPSFLKASLSDSRPQQLTFQDINGSDPTNLSSTASFKYEPIDYPLKNTQQLNVDWKNFSNHTFFSSAEVKTNVAFDQIINGYPFDGTKKEIEKFFDGISGFEKWVFDRFPIFGGQLHFSGTQVNEDPLNGYNEKLGTWIEVKDKAGWLYPDLSKNKSGNSILNPPKNKSFTIEAHVFLPNQINDRQVILQKMSPDLLQGFTLHIEPSVTDSVICTFSFISGSVANFVSAPLKKGNFSHICVSLSRELSDNYLYFFVNEKLISQSKKTKNFGEFTDNSSLTIGSGSSFYIDNLFVLPTQTLSGTLDEFRIFHSFRSTLQQQIYASKGLYASPDTLKLYFRFNEPPTALSSSPLDQVNSIVLDSSGNSLHSLIYNFDTSLRLSSEKDALNPMIHEKSDFKKILFPYNPQVISLNEELLSSASIYDQNNPNTITKLIPRHYFREGALEEGFSNNKIEGSIGNAYGGTGIPGQGELGSTQVMLTFLYIWAKFFDEIKMFVDAFKNLKHVDYYNNETIPTNFLFDLIRSYGFYLPPFFNSSNVKQYVDGEDVNGISIGDYALKEIQGQLLRRILINMPDIVMSKGTQHSIRSFLKSAGIDPDNSMRIREFGGPSVRHLNINRESRTEPIGIVKFNNFSLASTPFLSASRTEPGYPYPAGNFISGISNNPNDGLLTSGSWTLEGSYRYIPSVQGESHSLARLEVTGSSPTANPGVILNLFNSGSLYAYIRPGMASNSPILKLNLPKANILNGERWSVSVGCYRNDSINSEISSSYFLRAATHNAGEINKIYMTSSYFNETPSSEKNAFKTLDSLNNASGSRLSIGNLDIPQGIFGYLYLNDSLEVGDEGRTTKFNGSVNNIRFWSKGLTEDEWKEHVRNYKSFGVEDPLTNYNYVTSKEGSFERLRLDSFKTQNQKFADENGDILFLDFSENNFHLNGRGFNASNRVIGGDLIDYTYISPYFDEYSSSEKIRIRSFQNEDYIKDSPWASLAPVYEIPPTEIPLDDPRLSIEFSLIDSLNKDIICMFSNLNAMSTAIGNPELLYSYDYPNLEKLREVYFNRIKEKLNFRGFFEFYEWFDLSISTFIEQLVPRKTKFKGTNFIIESHMLERHKIEYQSSEIYLGDSNRSRIRDVLLVQQVVGSIHKF